jgi:predicted RNA-binding protein YlqC (UPF0109 family)
MDEKWSATEQHGGQSFKKSSRRSNYDTNFGKSELSNSTAPEELAEYIFRVLARDNDTGTLHFERTEVHPGRSRVTVTCDPAMTGRLIGKEGRTISALRLLIRAAAGRFGKRVDIEIA